MGHRKARDIIGVRFSNVKILDVTDLSQRNILPFHLRRRIIGDIDISPQNAIVILIEYFPLLYASQNVVHLFSFITFG